MSWVTYFKARRVMEWNKKMTLERVMREGGREVDMRNGPGGGGNPAAAAGKNAGNTAV